MRRLLPLISMFLLFPALSYGQAWSGILSSSRAIDWSNAGLPASFPDGETTANPWTPPTRTQCVTSACNTVSGGSVTATTINAAISSASAGTYVLIPSGTFAGGGTINMASNVTLRGSGAASTTLSGFTINWGSAYGDGAWGGGSLLTGTIAKGATSVTIASGQTVPTGGRMAALAQCMTGYTAPNADYTHYGGSGWVSSCTGTIADPSGPWVCGGYSQCDRNGNRGDANPHYQAQIFWIPASGISGNTVTLGPSPIESPLWSTGNSASLMWMSSSGTVGAGVEDFTSVGWIGVYGCYGCWMKGLRVIYTDTNPQLTEFVSHTLIANNYFVTNDTNTTQWSLGYENDTTEADSDLLMINNISYGGYWEEDGGNSGMVLAYNYVADAYLGSQSYGGEFQHNPGGQIFFLREGNQVAFGWDDDTWTTHNFDTWFRNWDSCYDPISGYTTPNCIDIGGFSRFDNVIGNVVGSSQGTGTYANVLGVNRNGIDTTALTADSLMRWGNYVFCTGSTDCLVSGGSFNSTEVPTNLSSFGANSTPYQNAVPANNNLPASFFMNSITAHPNGGTGLSWWKTCISWTTFPTSCASYTTPPMPPIGPDVTGGQNASGHAYNIPAYLAWSNLPVDSNYGNGIRRFDERVYETDSSSGPAAPINLTATVH